MVALWAPQFISGAAAQGLWMVLACVAVGLAFAAGVLAPAGGLALALFALLCIAARRARGAAATVVAHVALVVACAALFVHVVPGFHNPLLLSVTTSPDAVPYIKFLNFDKAMAALLLLGLYMPERVGAKRRTTEPVRVTPARADCEAAWRAFPWRFAALVVVVGAAMLAAGYARWDPKLPSWWPAWLWSMVFFTALPEEVLFRGWLQTGIASRLRGSRFGGSRLRSSRREDATAIIGAGALFGLAHAAGGPVYVVLATAAGIGYGWIYASTRSLVGAVAAHAGLNTMHLLFFTYPALRAALAS
jgi:hypothetical protein